MTEGNEGKYSIWYHVKDKQIKKKTSQSIENYGQYSNLDIRT